MCSVNDRNEMSQHETMLARSDTSCQVTDDNTGKFCGETEGLNILDEFQRLYETRIARIDRELNGDFARVSAKLCIMQEWVKNLGEQNVMLVRTVKDLENAAALRVRLLEDKLQHSSSVVAESMKKSNHTGETIGMLAKRISDLEQDEEHLQQKIEYLQNDIKGLLELIRRARVENHWNTDGIRFSQIEPEKDIPAPMMCICDQEESNTENMQSLKLEVEMLQEKERKMIAYQAELEEKVSHLSSQLRTKEETLRKCMPGTENYQTNVKEHFYSTNEECVDSCYDNCSKSNQNMVLTTEVMEEALVEKDRLICNLKQKLQCAEDAFRRLAHERDLAISTFQKLLDEKHRKTTALTESLSNAQQELQEKEEAFVEEIKRKNDKIAHLQRKVAQLKHHNNEASLQNYFQRQLIKELSTRMTVKDKTLSDENMTKLLLDQEQEAIVNLKMEIEKLLKNNYTEKEKYHFFVTSFHKKLENIKILLQTYKSEVIEYPAYAENMKNFITNMDIQLDNLQAIFKEQQISTNDVIDNMSIKTMEQNILMNPTMESQMKLIEAFKVCIMEVQSLKKELVTHSTVFHSHHQTDVPLEKIIGNTQKQLIKARERISDTMRKFETQENEQLRHRERIFASGVKLKKIKNSINTSRQLQLASYANGDRDNNYQNYSATNGTGLQNSNNLFDLVGHEVDEIIRNAEGFNEEGAYTLTMFNELKDQMYDVTLCMRELQRTIDEAMSDRETPREIFFNGQLQLEDLEKDIIHMCNKIKNVLELVQLDSTYTKDAGVEIHDKEERVNCEKKCQWSSDLSQLQKQLEILQQQDTVRRETESNLRKLLSGKEEELARLKEMIQSNNSDCGGDDALLYCYNQYKLEPTRLQQLFEPLQNAIHFTNHGLEELEHELEELMKMGGAHSCGCAGNESYANTLFKKTITNLIEKLNKYQDAVKSGSRELDVLNNTLNSKNKLLQNQDMIINVQKESIAMLQSELNELREKMQEKINSQDQLINQYEKERNELLKQNELQIQTIGHLQNAIVEAKRNLDHLGRKAITDLQEKDEVIQRITMYAEETQCQYNECFDQAAKQSYLLDLHREGINTLQERIERIECEKSATAISLQNTYNLMSSKIQEQFEARLKEIQKLKSKINIFAQSNMEYENNYLLAKKTFEESETSLEKLRKEAMAYRGEKSWDREEISKMIVALQNQGHELQLNALVNENKLIRKELSEWKLSFDELLKYLNIEFNDDDHTQQISLRFQRIKNMKLDPSFKELKEQQANVERLQNLLDCKENIAKEHSMIIEDLQKRLVGAEKQVFILQSRLASLNVLLTRRSSEMAKLEADYEMLMNNNVILKTQNLDFEKKTMENCRLQQKLKEAFLQLKDFEINQEKMREELRNVENNLAKAMTREVELNKELSKMEENYSGKLLIANGEVKKLEVIVEELKKDLRDAKANVTSTGAALFQFHDICDLYSEEINVINQQLIEEHKKAIAVEQSNRSLEEHLKAYKKQYCSLMQEKAFLNENNNKIVIQLDEMHKFISDLRQKCKVKDDTLNNVLVDLRQTTASRSKLCKESKNVVYCIRSWMEEQKQYVEKLIMSLSSKHRQLVQLAFEKKAFIIEIRDLRYANSLLKQKLRRVQRGSRVHNKGPLGQDIFYLFRNQQIPSKDIKSSCNYSQHYKKCQISDQLRKRKYSESKRHFCRRVCQKLNLQESQDYGYQSATSKYRSTE